MAEIIDLDDALPADKKVRLGGKVYTLPGDIPTELFLKIQRATGTLDQDDGIENLYGAVLELFQQRDPKVKTLPVGLAQMVSAFATIYGVSDQEERPTRTRGTGTSSSRAKTKSAS